MKLVTFDKDWADEFSPYGFAIMNEATFLRFKETYSKPQSWFFGSNEGYEAEDGDILFDGCTVKDITQDEADTIVRLFGLRVPTPFYAVTEGLFPDLTDVLA